MKIAEAKAGGSRRNGNQNDWWRWEYLENLLSQSVGETEKNLRRVFDAAEDCMAIPLFDEVDALFRKRSEVKDSHDRYANIEGNDLLQRMGDYRGLAILATNMKSLLDQAFLLRLSFQVKFVLTDAQHRQGSVRKLSTTGRAVWARHK